MKRFSWLLVVGLLAACSSKEEGREDVTKVDAGQMVADAAEVTSGKGEDAGQTKAADAVVATPDAGTEAGTAGFTCPKSDPNTGSACPEEEAICEYRSTLTCPVGCSGGDYRSYQCTKGKWVDYRHAAGAPQCSCSALSFPKGMQGTWRFSPSGSPDDYAWVRFSGLGDTLGDAGTPGQGTIEILAGKVSSGSASPWWSCNGQGLWFITQRPETFEVRPPAACTSAGTGEIYTVTSRQGAIPTDQHRCILAITMESASGISFQACKYADTQCDAAMKSCQSP
jgi:hypothetical protein